MQMPHVITHLEHLATYHLQPSDPPTNDSIPLANNTTTTDSDMSDERFTCKVINHSGLRLALAAWPSKLADGAWALQSFSSPSQAWDETVNEPGWITDEHQVRSAVIYYTSSRIKPEQTGPARS